MKKLKSKLKKLTFIILLVFCSTLLSYCNKSVEKIDELNVFKNNAYEGYYLKDLQLNEDESYRITLFNEEKIEVFLSVYPSRIEFRNNDTINAVYREIINGTYTGRYIIRLKSDFKIGKFFI